MSTHQPENSVRSIFIRALEIESPDERARYLTGACGDDAARRIEVESLLEAFARAGPFLEPKDPSLAPTVDAPSQAVDVSTHPPVHDTVRGERAGSVIGRYKLLQQIGEGGFGVVYMAEQEQPVKRRVALKIIKAGMDTRQVIARFEAERQALAMMDHPNIARVLDAGATDTGRPYFVMELVKGIPITDYCDEANLDMPRRLALFQDVCLAVQHAHQKGVIHRDLKPSNIMVTLHDGKPVVKVIDFGIAKATEQKLTEKTLFTQYGQMVGTPAYMSPEQAVMSGLDIDTRSDVYSLGVLLYELLTGSPPFDAKTLQSAGFDEMRRIIREQEPAKPSTKLGTLVADVRLSVAARRHVSPQVLARQLDGDLDWIVMRALEKDRARRYESASAFAQDIQRHLSGEPVSAAAPGTGYRLRKFVRRNKGAMTAAAAIALLLIAGTAVSAWQAVRATQATRDALEALAEKERAIVEKDAALAAERDASRVRDSALDAANRAHQQASLATQKAQKRLEQTEKANDILGSIFKSLDPRKIAQSERPLQAVLVEKMDEAVAHLDGEAIGDPLVVAAMQCTFGESLLALGEAGKAAVLLEKATATRTKELGPEHLGTLDARFHLGKAYLAGGKLEAALALNEETLTLRKRILGADHPGTLASMAELADTYRGMGRLDASAKLLLETLGLRKAKIGPDHHDTLASMNNLAHAYAQMGKIELALPLMEEALARLETRYGPTYPDTLATMGNLVNLYGMSRRDDDAVDLGERALKLLRTTMGPEHPATLTCINNLAISYQNTGKLDDAIIHFEQLLKINRSRLDPEHPRTLHSMNNLAAAYWRVGRLDKSIPLFEEAMKLQTATIGGDHVHTMQTKINLGVNYKDAGRFKEAVPLLEEGYRAAEKLPQYRWVVRPLLVAFARSGDEKKFADLLETMKKTTRQTTPDASMERAREWSLLCDVLIEAGAFAQAQPLLEESLSIREEFNPDDWATYHARGMLGASLLGQKKHAEAQPLLLAAYEGLKARVDRIPPRGRIVVVKTVDGLIELYTAMNKPDDATKWRAVRATYPQAGPK